MNKKEKLRELYEKYGKKCKFNSQNEFWLTKPVKIYEPREVIDFDHPNEEGHYDKTVIVSGDEIILFYVFKGSIHCVTEYGWDIEGETLDDRTFEEFTKYISNDNNVSV